MQQTLAAESGRIQLATTDRERTRALIAGCIGNFVEWYDFALYGAFAAVIATTFFPRADPLAGLMATFGVFGVAFLARPVGALLFGHFGDRVGRRRALAVGILLMAAVTAGIGLLPGYATLGWLAPALLVVLRAAQGVAVGGEYGGSAALVVEFAPSGRRGWYGGWQYATVGFGLAIGIGTAAVLGTVLTSASVEAWGWRLPFLLALPLGVVGLYVRARLGETPSFLATRRLGRVARAPLADALRTRRRQALIGFGVVAAAVVTFNVFYVFLPAYLTGQRETTVREAFGAAFIGLLVGSAVAPAFGGLSDRVGRRPVLLGGVLALLLLIPPAFSLISTGDTRSMLLGYVLVGVPLGSLALTAFLAELFPTPARYSGLSLTYGLGSAMFGGTAPLLATALVQRTGVTQSPVWYATITVAVGLVCVLFAPETAEQPLDADA